MERRGEEFLERPKKFTQGTKEKTEIWETVRLNSQGRARTQSIMKAKFRLCKKTNDGFLKQSCDPTANVVFQQDYSSSSKNS